MSRTRLALLLLTTMVVAGGGAGAAGAADVPLDGTALVSGQPSLTDPLPMPVADSDVSRQAVSGDGRYVAFASSSDGLLATDDDGLGGGIYRKDMLTGEVVLVSRANGIGGAQLGGRCEGAAAISDDGNRVAFACNGALDPADANGDFDVYVRDVRTEQTFLASRGNGDAGAIGAGDSFAPSLDGVGRVVAFHSYATNFGGHANGTPDVWARDLQTGTTTLVSAADGGTTMADGGSTSPSISNDGTRVAFVSDGTNLVSNDNNGVADVFVRDLSTRATVLASRADGAAGAIGNHASSQPAISGDGTFVAFTTTASNIDFNNEDPNTNPDVYLRALGTNATHLVSKDLNNSQASGGSAPAIDVDGHVVAFVSTATDLDAADTLPAADAYISVDAAEVSLVSRATGATSPAANDATSAVAVSNDGDHVVMGSVGSITGETVGLHATVAERTLSTATTADVARPAGSGPFGDEGGEAGPAALSADGRFMAFATRAPAFGAGEGLSGEVVAVRDLQTGTVTLASRDDGPAGAPLRGDVDGVSISADGSRVAFGVRLAGSPPQSDVVYVRDLRAATTVLAGRAAGAAGALANGAVYSPSLSADGTRVAFLSRATNLSPDDPDTVADVFVRDLSAQTTALVARADGDAGAKENGRAIGDALSGDGRHVAWITSATNLGDGDADTQDDVHVRDLLTGVTRLVDRADGAAGARADLGAAGELSIDGDGGRVAWTTEASNLGVTVPADVVQVWVRDVAAGRTILASRGDGADGAPDTGPDGGRTPLISADGRFVAFATDGGLAGPVPVGVYEAYRRDLTAGRTALVSRATGAAGRPAALGALATAIDADGGCVGFTADGDLVGGGSLDADQEYVRAFVANCGRPLTAPPIPAGPGGGGGGGGGGGTGGGGGVRPVARDITAPRLSGVSLSHRRFRVAKAGRRATAAAIARGTQLRLTTTEAGTLDILVERVRPGRYHGRGRKRTCQAVRHTPRTGRCKAYRKVWLQTATIRTKGKVKLAFSGRLGRRKLAAGSYRMTLVERDAAGNRSTPVRLALTIVSG